MAQKGRNELTSSIGNNIYDNGNKEIMAEMIRKVLNEMKDSFFNLKDDALADLKFEEGKTLKQYLNDIGGTKPESGAVTGIDGNAGANPTSFSTEGIISSASQIATAGGEDILYEINFTKSIATRQLIPVFEYPSGVNWNNQNDFTTPVIRRISSTRINLATRELARSEQNFTIRIIAI